MSWYKDQQLENDIVISASPLFLLTPICEKLQIKNAIASEVDDNGIFSGENCHGKQKVIQSQQRYPDDSINKFYSDSLTDKPLALLAREAFLVSRKGIVRWPFHK